MLAGSVHNVCDCMERNGCEMIHNRFKFKLDGKGNYDVQSAKQNYLPPLHTLGFDRIANRLRTLDPFMSLQYIVYTACRQYIVYSGCLHYIVYTESL